MKKSVLVVGAGLGGLATALRLAKQGFKVTIIEKNQQAGGRLNQIKKDGFTFDLGPSFFSMSFEFEEFARDCGIKLPFEYFELDPLYTVNIAGNPKTYFLYRDLRKLAEQFKEEEPDFEIKAQKYLAQAEKAFHDTIDKVVKRNFDSLLDYLRTLTQVSPIHLPLLFRSFWQQVNRHFSSQEARQIISLVAFFLGRTPFDTSAIYTLLSYTEFKHDGYYNVKGGMYKIVEGLLAELNKAGVEIVYNLEAVDFVAHDNKLQQLIDSQGKSWSADIIVVNADAAVFRSKVLKHPKYSVKKLDKMNWTMGYLTFYLGIKTKLPQVQHHNYFLGSNYEEYANNVMRNPDSLQKPYYYVNVLSRSNPECAPAGCESLFFVCPVPNLLFKSDWDDRDQIVNGIIADFSQRIGKDIKPEIVSQTICTPIEWQKMFNLHRGSGLGLSHKIMQIGGLRPPNYDEKFKNVFYVGASTIPGAGLPMAIISSKLAFERVERFVGQTN